MYKTVAQPSNQPLLILLPGEGRPAGRGSINVSKKDNYCGYVTSTCSIKISAWPCVPMIFLSIPDLVSN